MQNTNPITQKVNLNHLNSNSIIYTYLIKFTFSLNHHAEFASQHERNIQNNTFIHFRLLTSFPLAQLQQFSPRHHLQSYSSTKLKDSYKSKSDSKISHENTLITKTNKLKPQPPTTSSYIVPLVVRQENSDLHTSIKTSSN